jgi:hypothetical protein
MGAAVVYTDIIAVKVNGNSRNNGPRGQINGFAVHEHWLHTA